MVRERCRVSHAVFMAYFVFTLCPLMSHRLCAGQERSAGGPDSTTGPIWRDAHTRQVLFTIDDVLGFDWDDQVFLLKLDAALDFIAWMTPHRYQTRELVLEDEQGLIYRARWVSLASSMGFRGPIYESPRWTQFFRIHESYPSRLNAPADSDARFAPRLHAALKDKRILTDYDPNTTRYTTFDIPGSSTGWHDCGPDLKVRVDYFHNVFRSGRNARVHVFFAGDTQLHSMIDTVAVEVKFVANWGQYRSDVRIDDIPSSVLSDGIYICRFQPWTPCPGSVAAVEPGSGRFPFRSSCAIKPNLV